ncbi:helix-turn-helix domain-containing protein [Streptomyces sp. NPDC005548]|uniref:helix-turn-helix domain-containing protein n=1 Tax=Streptomyces sp. NPDC005548 TaxID=3364724 RepID=UPI00368CBFE7
MARAAVAPDTAETAPQIWHDNAQALRETREAAALDLHDAARHLDIKPSTLHRFEQATGKLPGRPVSVGYLQLLVLTCAQAGGSAPDCIPQAISQPVISLPTTPAASAASLHGEPDEAADPRDPATEPANGGTE